MMDDPAGGWLTVQEAARAYGWNARTVRRKIAGGALAARQVAGKFGPEWRVEPPPGYTPAPATSGAPDAPPVSTATPGAALIPLDSLERLLAPLAQERERLQQDLDQARAQIADLQTARLADAQEIGRLRGQLEGPPSPAPARPRRRWPWQR